jgi:murein L,D-transpeptidase YcbB/YkuD
MPIQLFLRLALVVVLALPVAGFAARGDKASASPEMESAIREVSQQIGRGIDPQSLLAFYGTRGYAPAWQLDSANAQAAAGSFVTYMRAILFEHGLTDRFYPFALFEKKVNSRNPRDILEADIIASHIVLKIARSLSGGDPVPTSDQDHVWPVKRSVPNIPQGLESAIERRMVPQYLESLAPQYTQYKKLIESLKRYRDLDAKGGWIRLVPGFSYLPGQYTAQTPLLYQRLAQEGYLPFEAARYTSTLYDPQLVAAIQSFQEAHGLFPDAHVGAQTLLALNMGVKERIDEIRANMARMRVTPPEAFDGIVINIPSFRLYMFRDTNEIYQAPVVVGRPDRPSPLLASNLNEMIINPSWYVPESIAEKDILPRLQENPDYLEELNMKGPDAERIANGGSLQGAFVQKPGPENSLGRIKFNFPNRFSVYLHGTPHVELFDRDDRRQSSGCIRLKKPEELAEILMGNSGEWSEARIQDRIDSMKTQHITPRLKMPIKVLYWTVMVDSRNRVQFYNDVYQLDDAWLAPL